MTKTNQISNRTEQVELSSPNDILAFATQLKDLIVQNGLYAPIKGKNYVNVEGWQIAGAFTGTYPMVEKVENLSEGRNCKYRAEVSLRDKDGRVVGYGVAVCTNQEAGKTNFDEYAVASMAQTRAVGKAYRMKLGWLLKIAGYETTPAEEMDAVEARTIALNRPQKGRVDFEAIKAEIATLDTIGDLMRHHSGIVNGHNLTDKQKEGLKKIYAHRRKEIQANDKAASDEIVAESQAEWDARVDSEMASTRYEVSREEASERMRNYGE